MFSSVNPTPNKRIAVVAGDGIGKEVIREALSVVRASQAKVEFVEFDWSADRYLRDGTTIPEDGFAMLSRDFEAILVGALGDPRVPSNVHAKDILLGMRFKMDLDRKSTRLNSSHSQISYAVFCLKKKKKKKKNKKKHINKKKK